MTKIEATELRNKSEKKLKAQMADLKKEIIKERGQIEVGGFAENPGQLNEKKKTIARIKTILNEKSTDKQ